MYYEYRVLPMLDTTSRGPVARDRAGIEQMVHLQQGDLDGACGPYAVLMGLLTLGVVKRDDVAVWGPLDRRTKVGKLITRMSEGWTTLFRDGTNLDDLTDLIGEIFRTNLEVETFEGAGIACRSFAIEHVLNGSPVVLGLQWDDGAHWVLAVGIESIVTGESREPRRILVLDPGAPPLPVCPWNGNIDARGSGGRYPYTWWSAGAGGERKVALDSAMALSLMGGQRLHPRPS